VSRPRCWQLLPLLAFVAACASSPQASPEERAVKAIEGANAAYEEILLAAGRAYTNGTIGDEELAQVRAAGRLAEQALRGAKASLEAYLVLGGAVEDAGLESSLQDLQSAITNLLGVWEVSRG
jgi:hypothetical protein